MLRNEVNVGIAAVTDVEDIGGYYIFRLNKNLKLQFIEKRLLSDNRRG